MKKLSLLVVVLFASLSMFANVNPVVKFNIDNGKLAKAKKSATKKNVAENNVLKTLSAKKTECPNEYTLIIDYDQTPSVEIIPCSDPEYYREEITFDDLYFLYVKLYNSICMVEFDGLYSSWVVTSFYMNYECPDL